ncbi:MAG: DUF1573 domain-containing protein [Thermoguttaceae bacterium]|nr:DUF1573 domain-containing protein [Thermoguttaceae bacterium]
MKTRYGIGIVLAVALAVAAAVLVRIVRKDAGGGDASAAARLKPQCAHWAVVRCCQLLGVPVDMGEVVARLPPTEPGHSMLDLAAAMRHFGLEAEGCRETWQSLDEKRLPCVAHLKDPDHFVVVSGLDRGGGFVHLFDGSGNRTRPVEEVFERRWSGAVLYAARSVDAHAAGASSSAADKAAPRARFERLLLDKGDVPSSDEPIEFAFAFWNNGGADLVVRAVRTSCGCVQSEKPDAPVPPNGRGVIKLFYRVAHNRGPFSQTAVVLTNDPAASQIMLTACGYSGSDVKIEPSPLYLRDAIVGRENVATCFVRYAGEQEDIEIRVAEAAIEGVRLVRGDCTRVTPEMCRELSPIECPQTPSPVGRVYRLALVLFPTGEAGRKFKGKVVLTTNLPRQERLDLWVHGRLTTPVVASPGIVDFGEVGPDDILERTVVLVGRTGQTPEVLDVSGQPGGMRVESLKPAPGQGLALGIRATGAGALQAAGKHLNIRCRLRPSGEEINIRLPVAAWPRVAGTGDQSAS